jgi:hypothetical protein
MVSKIIRVIVPVLIVIFSLTSISLCIGKDYIPSRDIYVLKADQNGEKQWDIRFDSGVDDDANIITQTTDDGYTIAGGLMNNQGPCYPNIPCEYGKRYPRIIKLNKNGTVLWDKNYKQGGASGEAISLAITKDRGYIISTYYNEVLKLNGDGVVSWNKSFDRNTSIAGIWSIIQPADGKFIFAGQGKNETTRIYMAWVVSLDENGELLWERMYPGEFRFEHLIQTSDGGYLVASDSNTVYKLDITGQQVWKQALDGRIVKIREISDQYDILLKEGTKDVFISPNGSVIREKNVQATTPIIWTKDGGYAYATVGTMINLFKLNGDGRVQWTRSYPNTYGVMIKDLIQTSDDGYGMLFTYERG